VFSEFSGGISFISNDPFGAQTHSPIGLSNRSLLHQIFCYADFMLLTRRQQKRDDLPFSIYAQMDFCTQPTSTTP
jgi:hypothetical protein